MIQSSCRPLLLPSWQHAKFASAKDAQAVCYMQDVLPDLASLELEALEPPPSPKATPQSIGMGKQSPIAKLQWLLMLM